MWNRDLRSLGTVAHATECCACREDYPRHMTALHIVTRCLALPVEDDMILGFGGVGGGPGRSVRIRLSAAVISCGSDS